VGGGRGAPSGWGLDIEPSQAQEYEPRSPPPQAGDLGPAATAGVGAGAGAGVGAVLRALPGAQARAAWAEAGLPSLPSSSVHDSSNPVVAPPPPPCGSAGVQWWLVTHVQGRPTPSGPACVAALREATLLVVPEARRWQCTPRIALQVCSWPPPPPTTTITTRLAVAHWPERESDNARALAMVAAVRSIDIGGAEPGQLNWLKLAEIPGVSQLVVLTASVAGNANVVCDLCDRLCARSPRARRSWERWRSGWSTAARAWGARCGDRWGACARCRQRWRGCEPTRPGW
jgi:hypothetical protein